MARVYPRTRAHTYTYTIIKRQCLSVVWGSIPILWWELSSTRLYENISIVFNLKGLRPIHVRVIIYAGLSHHFFVKPFMVVYKHWSLKMQIETSYLYFKIIYITLWFLREQGFKQNLDILDVNLGVSLFPVWCAQWNPFCLWFYLVICWLLGLQKVLSSG